MNNLNQTTDEKTVGPMQEIYKPGELVIVEINGMDFRGIIESGKENSFQQYVYKIKVPDLNQYVDRAYYLIRPERELSHASASKRLLESAIKNSNNITADIYLALQVLPEAKQKELARLFLDNI
jgi:hypothetical protein